MKSRNPVSTVHSLQEQLADARLDKDPIAAQLLEDWIEQVTESYELKTCQDCLEIFEKCDVTDGFCASCAAKIEALKASDDLQYRNRSL